MLPNRSPDAGGAPEYNTVDATLWYFEAIRAYAARIGDVAFVRDHLYQVLAGMIRWHECGTRYGIRVDADRLLHAGEPGAQLTWMDAKVGDWVVTPRRGKPVEIQALWYNALRVMERGRGAANSRDVTVAGNESLFWIYGGRRPVGAGNRAAHGGAAGRNGAPGADPPPGAR
jgi:predicted glycogen debranching enzyme